jgi:hypothetical protein
MTENDAKGFATQETGRHAGSTVRRTFRAESVTTVEVSDVS